MRADDLLKPVDVAALMRVEVIDTRDIPALDPPFGAGANHYAYRLRGSAKEPELAGKVYLHVKEPVERAIHNTPKYAALYTRQKAIGLLTATNLEQLEAGSTLPTLKFVVDDHGHLVGSIHDYIPLQDLGDHSWIDQERGLRKINPLMERLWNTRINSGEFAFAAHGDPNKGNIFLAFGPGDVPIALFTDFGPQVDYLGPEFFSYSTHSDALQLYSDEGGSRNTDHMSEAELRALLAEMADFPDWVPGQTSQFLEYRYLRKSGELPFKAYQTSPNQAAFTRRIVASIREAQGHAEAAGKTQTALTLKGIGDRIETGISGQIRQALNDLGLFANVVDPLPFTSLVIYRAPR